MSSIVAFVLLLGPLVFVHELGHLLAAKLVDVKVSRFSIGFGPAIFRFSIGETEYCLAPIPLGGYVRLLGQSPYEEIPAQEADRSLSNKPLWARYFVLAAGPLTNFLLPLILYFLFFLGQSTHLPPVIGTVLPDSAAYAAGIESGDRVVSIDEDDISSWQEMRSRVSDHPEEELKIQVERDGKRFARYVTPRRSFINNAIGVPESRGLLGVYPWFYAPQIGVVDPTSRAFESGIRTGDVITSVNGEPVQTIEDLQVLLGRSGNALIRLTYLRGRPVDGPLGTYLWLESNHAQLLPKKGRSGQNETGIAPANTFIRYVEPGSPADRAGLKPGDRILEAEGKVITRWESLGTYFARKREDKATVLAQSPGENPRTVEIHQELIIRRSIYKQPTKVLWLGAEPYASQFVHDREPIHGRFAFATRAAVSETASMLHMMWTALRQMVTLERGVEDLTSVVGIFNYAGTAADQGSTEFMLLMALISLNLGFVNLLPIPILDGGHLLFFTIEALRRRQLGQRAREIASSIGIIFVLLLLLIALRNDIMRYWMD